MAKLIGTASFPVRLDTSITLDVSIAAGATDTSGAIAADWADRARVLIDDAGADVSAALQTSADGGVTWHDMASYAAGTTGAQAVEELCDVLLRLSASNAGLVAQDVIAHLLVQV